jgi:co-chaperonin GroES (HSP10)
MNLRLMGNRVLIEPVEEETAHGFVIPEQYRQFRAGIVKAVGNGTRRKDGQRNPIPLQVGEAVVLSDDYRMPIDIEGKQHFIVSDEKVMCVLEKQ